MQLRLDAADRLVALVEEAGAPVAAEEAAAQIFAARRVPAGLAASLLAEAVRADARLTWIGTSLALAAGAEAKTTLEAATFVVVDLETTGLSPGRAAICEIGAVQVRALMPEATFQTLVDPRAPLPPAISSLTGLDDREL